jgi:predicted amidophosphoribosyltransferase
MGEASKEFKQGMKEGPKEAEVEGPCPFCEADVAKDSKFCPGCGKPATEIVAAREAQTQKSA